MTTTLADHSDTGGFSVRLDTAFFDAVSHRQDWGKHPDGTPRNLRNAALQTAAAHLLAAGGRDWHPLSDRELAEASGVPRSTLQRGNEALCGVGLVDTVRGGSGETRGRWCRSLTLDRLLACRSGAARVVLVAHAVTCGGRQRGYTAAQMARWRNLNPSTVYRETAWLVSVGLLDTSDAGWRIPPVDNSAGSDGSHAQERNLWPRRGICGPGEESSPYRTETGEDGEQPVSVKAVDNGPDWVSDTLCGCGREKLRFQPGTEHLQRDLRTLDEVCKLCHSAYQALELPADPPDMRKPDPEYPPEVTSALAGAVQRASDRDASDNELRDQAIRRAVAHRKEQSTDAEQPASSAGPPQRDERPVRPRGGDTSDEAGTRDPGQPAEQLPGPVRRAGLEAVAACRETLRTRRAAALQRPLEPA